MFAVAGANCFGQWFFDEIVIEGFETVSKKIPEKNFDLDKAKLIQTNWSYNIYEIDGIFYISGSWMWNEKQLLTVPLPIDFPKDCVTMVVTGNDNFLLLIDVEKQMMFIMDFKHKTQAKKLNLGTDQERKSELESIKNNKNNQMVKVMITNNACIYMRAINRDVKVYAGLYPQQVSTDHVVGEIIDVQCGYEHYVLLTDTGRVYTWGNGRRFQLGHGNIDNISIPQEVRALSGFNIKKIRAGGWHTAVVNEFGDLYMWGWNDVGQLGIKSRAMRRKELRDGPSNRKKRTHPISTIVNIYNEDLNSVALEVIDLCCGSKHTVIMLSDYSIWATGSNEYGQLGLAINDYNHIEHFVKVYQGTSKTVLQSGPWTTVIEN